MIKFYSVWYRTAWTVNKAWYIKFGVGHTDIHMYRYVYPHAGFKKNMVLIHFKTPGGIAHLIERSNPV